MRGWWVVLLSACASAAPPPPPPGPTLPAGKETPAIPGADLSPPAPPPLPIVASGTPVVGLPVGSEAPAFSLKLMNAERAKLKSMSLSDHVGKGAKGNKRGVLLSFAASYCAPCKKELADLAKAEPEWRKAGLVTAVVVIDTDDAGIEAMRRFLVDELALDFPVLGDRFAILARRYRADALPYVVLVDRAGKIVWSHAGYDPEGLRSVLSKL